MRRQKRIRETLARMETWKRLCDEAQARCEAAYREHARIYAAKGSGA